MDRRVAKELRVQFQEPLLKLKDASNQGYVYRRYERGAESDPSPCERSEPKNEGLKSGNTFMSVQNAALDWEGVPSVDAMAAIAGLCERFVLSTESLYNTIL